MTTTLETMTDVAIRNLVQTEINWVAQITEPADIGVAVHDGVVTLTGTVSSFVQKVAAAKAALRTRGVVAVANEIEVVIGPRHDDTTLAERAAHALALNSIVPEGSVHVQVSNGVVSLTGSLPWNFQRDAARKTVEGLQGVKDVDNNISLLQRASSFETKAHIRAAFERIANIDANKLDVSVDGTTVTLSGTVSSDTEKRAAANAAWHSPNVGTVVNNLSVAP